MLNSDNLLMLLASLLLVAVDWLAFHDIRETHSVRDWLMLAASLLVFLKFVRDFWKRYIQKKLMKDENPDRKNLRIESRIKSQR